MNELQLELTKLIGSKELTFWCIVNDTDYDTWTAVIFRERGREFIVSRDNDLSKPYLERKTDVEDWEIIGHPPTMVDFYVWCDKKGFWTTQNLTYLHVFSDDKRFIFIEKYDSTKELIEQSDETLNLIINFIKSHN